MSATRISLLATAAILGGVLAPTATSWAQPALGYGTKSIVDHNDLRWFEPVELDLDGQMPRRDAGFYFSADKIWWGVIHPKLEIGHEGLVVDSERIFPAPTIDVAITALEQFEGQAFTNSLGETLSYTSVSFARYLDNGANPLDLMPGDDPTPNALRDDTEFRLGLNPAVGTITDANLLNYALRDTSGFIIGQQITNVTQLKSAIDQAQLGFTRRDSLGNPIDANGNIVAANDPSAQVAPTAIRVGDEPIPYGVQNGIRDALPDAGFAWGERFEFGYSNGEQGWMMTVIDGPESQAGGVYGAGEGHIYFSQSGTEIFGPDPYFLGDLDDDDGDGIGDGDGEQGAADIWALGFGSVAVNFNLPNEDFLTGFRDYNNGQTPFTTSGPIMYVGNVGSAFNDINVVGIGGSGGGAVGDQVPTSLTAIDAINNILAPLAPGSTVDANTSNSLNNAYALILAELDPISDANVGNAAIIAQINQIATLLNFAQNADGTLTGLLGGTPPPDFVAGTDNVGDAQVQALTADNLIEQLNTLLIASVDDGGGAGTNQNITTTEEQRQGDDLNSNGNPGFIRVIVQDNDGDDVLIGTIVDNGDFHVFNVFFDQVTVRNTTEIDGVELMRTHELSTRHKLQQGRWDDLRLSYGVRFLNIEDDFYFNGIGSVLGRTWVNTNAENQIIAPQLGLKWTRRDGPWNFILEARGAVGYNVVDVDQEGIFGYEAIPGALNRSALARTTTSVDGFRFDEFSPIGELRAQLRYRLAEAISVHAGYTAKYVGNIHRGGESTAWNAPDFGVHDHTGDIFVNGLNIGIELRH